MIIITRSPLYRAINPPKAEVSMDTNTGIPEKIMAIITRKVTRPTMEA